MSDPEGSRTHRPATRARPQAGFALVELLIVAALLAVLAGAAVAVYANSRQRAKDTMCEHELQTLETAVESYQTLTGYLPSNQGILVPNLLPEPSSMWTYEPPYDLRTGEPGFVATPECA